MTIPLENGPKEILKRRKHWLATLWKLERTDGVTFRFTSNTQKIIFENEEYTPLDSVQASARRKQADLAVENLELVGVITADAITHDDLRAGLYREAKITETWIDYRFPWLPPFTVAKYEITELKFSGERWEAKVESVVRRLRPKVGRLYTRECDNDLGDSVCLVDVVGLSENGTVFDITGAGLNDRSNFTASGLTEVLDFFTHGRLIWTTGLNTGPGAEHQLELQLPSEFPIDVLDQFNVQPGCDKLRDT